MLAEFGVVVAQSPKALRECLGELVEDGSNELCVLARLVIERARQHLRELDEHIAWCVSASSSALEAAIAATK